jgi:hypothetical protein
VSVYFKSSPPPHGAYNHQHADQNSFVINAGGKRLAIESGYYDGWKTPHWWNWLKHTRAKNAVTYDGGKGQIFLEQMGYKRTGYGRITRFDSAPGYDIAAGDATHAYDGELTRALRTLVYLRPNLLLVHDRLASRTPRRWEWNIHAVNRMKEKDQGIEIENDGQRLCVQMLGTKATFQQTDEWLAEPTQGDGRLHAGVAPRKGEPQWHGRFATAPLPAAQFLALLDVGCRSGAGAAQDAGGGWTVKAGGRTVRIGADGQASVQ